MVRQAIEYKKTWQWSSEDMFLTDLQWYEAADVGHLLRDRRSRLQTKVHSNDLCHEFLQLYTCLFLPMQLKKTQQ